MKLIKYLLSIILSIVSLSTNACGPYLPLIPQCGYFYFHKIDAPLIPPESSELENCELWRSITDSNISRQDIFKVVYEDSCEEFYSVLFSKEKPTENKFYRYILENKDDEVRDFLWIAKNLEQRRRDLSSPWYYPSSRIQPDDTGELSDIVEKCLGYKGNRLADRYALQAIRALFSEKKFRKCIQVYDKKLKNLPDDNLFKKLAKGYVAGSRIKTGDRLKGYKMFAELGKYDEILKDGGVEFVALSNPDCNSLIDYINDHSIDSGNAGFYKKIVLEVLRRQKTQYPGAWQFLLAYIEGEFFSNYSLAQTLLDKALTLDFPSPGMLDEARVYKAKINASLFRQSSLAEDMFWFEKNITPDNPKLVNSLKSLIYKEWAWRLWKKKEYATAILLCAFAENINAGFADTDGKQSVYGALSFRLMESLTSGELIRVKNKIESDTSAFYGLLKKYARLEPAMLDELIGTIALREEKYDLAKDFLRKVPPGYIREMNIYPYLASDPFAYCRNLWDDLEADLIKDINGDIDNDQALRMNKKYLFASEMARCQRMMKNSPSADERGIARLKYAIGRKNSFDDCNWALTQYWRGRCVLTLFQPYVSYDYDEVYKYDFLYDYEETIGDEKTHKIFRKEIRKAMNEIKSDEAKAHALYLLGHLKTIKKSFPHTRYGHLLKTSCDNWSAWL